MSVNSGRSLFIGLVLATQLVFVAGPCWAAARRSSLGDGLVATLVDGQEIFLESKRGVTLISAGLDEVPMVYRDIDRRVSQAGLISDDVAIEVGYAICGAAAVVEVEGGKCKSASLAFNGVTAVPHHAAAVGAALAGSDLSDEAIDKAVSEHLSIDDPLGDVQATGEYRVQLAGVYGKRALKAARDRA